MLSISTSVWVLCIPNGRQHLIFSILCAKKLKKCKKVTILVQNLATNGYFKSAPKCWSKVFNISIIDKLVYTFAQFFLLLVSLFSTKINIYLVKKKVWERLITSLEKNFEAFVYIRNCFQCKLTACTCMLNKQTD